jgi:hypothetical protein
MLSPLARVLLVQGIFILAFLYLWLDRSPEKPEKQEDFLSNDRLIGFSAREGILKEKMLKRFGGNKETEDAVSRALVWLAEQRKDEGIWEFDGSHQNDHIAATGMCLLTFLAAGETHLNRKCYSFLVAKGIEFLRSQIKDSGQFGDSGMYSQAIATMAICEAAGMTDDVDLKKVAKKAIDYIVRAQALNGSWGYTAGCDGDTSIVGWQIQALQSGKLAGIGRPDSTLKKAEVFLRSVSDESESRYYYRGPDSIQSPTLSAVGLLSRAYLTDSSPKPLLARGVRQLWEENPPTETFWDIYYYYHATLAFYSQDGDDWHKNWNPAMRKVLLDKQIAEGEPNDIGSWPKDSGFIGSSCGKLGTTALACLTLEVYYRQR